MRDAGRRKVSAQHALLHGLQQAGSRHELLDGLHAQNGDCRGALLGSRHDLPNWRCLWNCICRGACRLSIVRALRWQLWLVRHRLACAVSLGASHVGHELSLSQLQAWRHWLALVPSK